VVVTPTPETYTVASHLKGVATMEKPQKPYPEFPLFAHASGKWAKKIKGKIHYFGKWDNPIGALEEYNNLVAGGQQRPATASRAILDLRDGLSVFLTSKRVERDAGALSHRTFNDYKRTGKKLIDFFGKHRPIESLTPSDFTRYRNHRLETINILSMGNECTRIKTILKWLAASKHTRKIDTGPDFRKASSKALRAHKRKAGLKLFTADEIHKLLDESGIHMRAMILLGINCGFGNGDCNEIPLSILSTMVDTGWLEYPRPKTEVDRRCPVWPETREAVKLSISRRPASNLPNGFLQANGVPYSDGNADISKRFRAIRDAAKIKVGGFYWLRHTFQTQGEMSRDHVAVSAIMGHVDDSMAGNYRELVQDERLLHVTETIRTWLHFRL